MKMQSEKSSPKACYAKDKTTHIIDSTIKYQLMNTIQLQIFAKEKGKTLRWNREPYKGDTSTEGLQKTNCSAIK